jgi:hypothetical protein
MKPGSVTGSDALNLTHSPVNPYLTRTVPFIYSASQLSQFPWIASSATLRVSDCVVAWADCLAQVAALRGETLDRYLRRRPADQRLLNVAANISARPGCELMSATTADRLHWLTNDIVFALNNVAPVGTWFGSHPGDGACFGFWLIDDAEAVAELLSLPPDPSYVVGALQAIDAMGLDCESFADAPIFPVTGDTLTDESVGMGDHAECGWVEPDGSALLTESTPDGLWSVAELIDAFAGYAPEPSCYPGEPRWLTISSDSGDAILWQSPWRFAAATDGAIGASLSVHRPDNLPAPLWQIVCAALGYRFS